MPLWIAEFLNRIGQFWGSTSPFGFAQIALAVIILGWGVARFTRA
jgi:hypothetical protein